MLKFLLKLTKWIILTTITLLILIFIFGKNSPNHNESCAELRYNFLDCVHKTTQGKPCLKNTNIVLPERCKN